jgi:hypothetical protein
LYRPKTSTAGDALGDYLEASGLRVSIRLPDPAPVSTLPYGELPYASYRVSLRNGRQPTREAVEDAVKVAYAKLKTLFGEAALDLNGTLIGEL